MCMFRPMKPRHIAVDVSIAAMCVFFELAIPGALMSVVALIGMAIAVALRRLSPGLALALVWVTALIQVFFNLGADTSNVAIFAVLYTSASYGSTLVKWWGLASTFAGALILTVYLWLSAADYTNAVLTGPVLTDSLFQIVVTFLLAFGTFALSWTLGLLAKTWRTSRESNVARILAERARRDAQQDFIVEQERNRIARDMHDVVAHSLAVVIAQADGARYAREVDPEAVDGALATISSTAREALGDVRILLGQLRHSEAHGPQPVLADLDRLYDQMRSSGLSLQVQSSGTPAPLPAGAQLAVYRIVQEALTNALRHGAARGDTAVKFQWDSDGLQLTITNPVQTMPHSDVEQDGSSVEPGHGVAGMTERAILAGGSMTATPRDGLFVVDATFPLTVNEVLE